MTDINVSFKKFLATSQLAISQNVGIDSAVAPTWEEVYRAGYQSAIESVGDLVLSEDKSQEVDKLKKEIATLKGQLTKAKKK